MPADNAAIKSANIVRDAGGQIVGRARLQKVGYFLELAGFDEGFDFEYRSYGPYSALLSTGISLAKALDIVDEEERPAEGGGLYSIYRLKQDLGKATPDRSAFVLAASGLGPTVLELAATAAFIRLYEPLADAWEETRRRKPEKAGAGRLETAKLAYDTLRRLSTPRPLPEITDSAEHASG